MTAKEPAPGEDTARLFAEQVEQKSPGMLSELFGLIRHNKKWWLTPIIAAAFLLGALMVLFGTPLSPLIYTLF